MRSKPRRRNGGGADPGTIFSNLSITDVENERSPKTRRDQIRTATLAAHLKEGRKNRKAICTGTTDW